MFVSLPQNSLDQSLVIDNTMKGYQISIPGVFSKNDNSFPRTAKFCNQISDGQSFSCCTTISNGISSEGACTTTVSPERVLYLNISDTEQESSLNKSVNSYNQRKRKQKDSQDKSCDHIDSFNHPNAEHCYQFDCMTTRNIARYSSQRIESTFANSSSNCEPQKQLDGILVESNKGISPISSDISGEKKLHICCLFCKNPLGLLENNFLVACSSTSLSKVYLSYILNHGPSDYNLSERLFRTPTTDIRVMISDISSVDQRMFTRYNKEGAAHHDTWCEEDGCVFRNVFCPFCTVTCLGVQIKATDAANVHLLNKVMYSDGMPLFVYTAGLADIFKKLT